MVRSRMKSLSVPRLLPLLCLLISTFPLWSQAQNRLCFVCSWKNPKCEEGLSAKDNGLLQECSRGKDGSVVPLGCQVFIIRNWDYEYPKEILFWRDCLYPSDLDTHNITLPPNIGSWYSGSQLKDSYNTTTIDYPGSLISLANWKRGELGLPLMEEVQWLFFGTWQLQYYVHPERYYWNMSNGLAAKTLYPDFYKVTPMQDVKCFVCSHEDPGCEGDLSSSSTHLIQDCVGSEETTVPIGCQVLVAQFEYPEKTYFYRDCLYENYLGCHYAYQENPVAEGENWKETDGYYFHLSNRINCMNQIRSYLGLKSWKEAYPFEESKPATILYFLHGEPEPGRGHEHMIKHLNQPSLSNGAAIEGLISKQPTPPDFKIKGTFSCHNCDTQTGKCGGEKDEILGELPQQQCMTPNEDAYGCMSMWTIDFQRMETKWMRKGCWYKGDLFCLRRLNMSSSSPTGRSGGECADPGGGGSCDARKLIKEGKTVYWEDYISRYILNEKVYEELRGCMRNIRLRLGVTDGLPELPKFEDGIAESSLWYSACAGRSLCNDKEAFHFKYQTTTTTSTSSTTTTPTPPPVDPCKPHHEFDYPGCTPGPGPYPKDTAWSTSTIVLITVAVTLCIIGIGGWLWSKRRDRVGAALPVDNRQPGEQGLSQLESNRLMVEHPSSHSVPDKQVGT